MPLFLCLFFGVNLFGVNLFGVNLFGVNCCDRRLRILNLGG